MTRSVVIHAKRELKPNMNRFLLFGNLVFAFVASRLADIGSTYYFIPELGIAEEANPLVSIARFQWIELLIFQFILGVGVILFAAYYSFGRTEPVQCKSHSLRTYASICLFNQDLEISRFLRGLFLGYPIPTNWHQLFRFYGFTLIVSLTAASYFAAASWWMNHYFQISWFTYLYQASGGVGNYPLIVVYFGLFVSLIASYYFFWSEHRFAKMSHG